MTRRLYVVRIVRQGFVLAESADAALKATKEIEQWETHPEVTVAKWRSGSGESLLGWDDKTLVYGTDKDTTLAEAKREHQS